MTKRRPATKRRPRRPSSAEFLSATDRASAIDAIVGLRYFAFGTVTGDERDLQNFASDHLTAFAEEGDRNPIERARKYRTNLEQMGDEQLAEAAGTAMRHYETYLRAKENGLRLKQEEAAAVVAEAHRRAGEKKRGRVMYPEAKATLEQICRDAPGIAQKEAVARLQQQQPDIPITKISEATLRKYWRAASRADNLS